MSDAFRHISRHLDLLRLEPLLMIDASGKIRGQRYQEPLGVEDRVKAVEGFSLECPTDQGVRGGDHIELTDLDDKPSPLSILPDIEITSEYDMQGSRL